MIWRRGSATVLATLAATAALALAAAPAAGADLLLPEPGQVFFGLTDSGVASQFGEFAEAVGKHPAVIETFRPWGGGLAGSVKRWQSAEARPILHISTADPVSGGEIITPRGIALGRGDDYLLWLNRLFWEAGMRAYLRPLGEPNRCLNVYAAYDCEGGRRPGWQSARWYRLAFRRMYVVLHGGGSVEAIDASLAAAGLPPLSSQSGTLPAALPAAPIDVVWSPLPTGAPGTRRNLPGNFWPGSAYVDWVGTDFYSGFPDWRALNAFYGRFAHRRRKPFALTEWGVTGDDPGFVRKLFTWVGRHPLCRMLVYYQDFGYTSAYRLQSHPASLAVVRRRLSSPVFPEYAYEPPRPPPGGVAPSPSG